MKYYTAHKIDKFINKYGKHRWIKHLHNRLNKRPTSVLSQAPSYYMEEILKQYDHVQMKLNKIEDRLGRIEESNERIEIKQS